MKTKFIIYSFLVICILLLVPTIPAVEYHITEETNKTEYKSERWFLLLPFFEMIIAMILGYLGHKILHYFLLGEPI
ncbi:MAG: hypothetical protein NT038_08460 [Euryarchaeota archaeon]|nr:hypothetical protein [Euryarchaeota archaeon]